MACPTIFVSRCFARRCACEPPASAAHGGLLRADLVAHIRKVISKLGITQAEAAQRAGMSQPRMNDLVKGRTHKFTLDALVNVAAQLGYTVKLSVKKAA